MEISQYTYFQQVGGLDCSPVSLELTYGLERLAMYVLDIDNVYDLPYNDDGYTYGQVFKRNEQQMSAYNFEFADTEQLFQQFIFAEKSCQFLLEQKLALPAYEQCMKASHSFNLLDSRGVISVLERQGYILRVRALAKGCCETWSENIAA